ncbi:MAG TPA: hypothetical protein VFG50_14205 [Rhodothermales bacterium]|nr:hypothetical protein [Rhodothermales bacterium]
MKNKKLTLLLILGACSVTYAAQAQTDLIALESAPVVHGSTPAEIRVYGFVSIQHMDLSHQSAAWWKVLREDHARVLRTADIEARAHGLQNIIYLATVYPKESKMRLIARDIYNVYRLGSDEPLRLMAVHALNVIGDVNTLWLLSQDVKLESSPRLRTQIIAALAGHSRRASMQGGDAVLTDSRSGPDVRPLAAAQRRGK